MPEELPAVLTAITLEQALQALHDAWKKQVGSEPKKESLWLLAAHWGFETGWGKSMYCYNFGNAKHVEGDGRDWTYYKCSEILGGKVQYFLPKHPTSAFRAFRTLLAGTEDYFDLIHKRFKAAWPAVEAGDPRQYAHALKQQKYYTDDEEHYTKTMVGCYAHAKAAKWDPSKAPELPKEAHPEIGEKDPFGAHAGADFCIAAYERAITARGFRLDAENEKSWKVEDQDLGPGAFEKVQPRSGDLALLATADGPRSGRVVSVAAAVGKSYEGAALFAAGVFEGVVGVKKLQLETRPNGFNANGGEAWKEGEPKPGAGKAWALRILRLSEALPDRLAKLSDDELKKWHIKKGEVEPSPATDLRWDAKKKPNDPTIMAEDKEAQKDAPSAGKGKKAVQEADDSPATFKTPPPVVQLPPPKQVDARTVRFQVGNYPGRIAFTIKKPGEPLPTCPPPGKPAKPAAEGKRDDFIRAAMNMLGVPYLAGGHDPAKGLDGAGLAGLCLKRVGLLKESDEPPDAGVIHGMFGAIGGKPDAPPEEIIPGDLAWFGRGDHDTDAQQHCMIYLGGGRVLGPIADGGPQNGAVQVIAASAVPEHFAGWSHIADLGRDTGHTEHPGHPPMEGDAISSALVPASPASRYDLLKALVGKKGGTWLDEKGKVNIVSVRSMQGRCQVMPRNDDYNDTLFACFQDEGGHKCSLELRASVNPGTDAEKAGKWHLVDGSYKFKLEKDGEEKVLRPDGNVKAWFDEHGQGSLRPGDLVEEAPAKEEAKGPAPTKEEAKKDEKKDEKKEEPNEEKKKEEPDEEDKAYDYFKKLITETVKGLVESGKLKCAKPPVEFAEADGAINIIGIRSMTDWVAGKSEDNAYDDWLVQVWMEGGEKRVEGFKATVDPGKYWRDHPMSKAGAAHLMEGQWRYKLGTHQDGPAGNQAAEVTVWRDKDGSGKFQENFDTGWFGINNHHGGSDFHAVGKWSAGCQVVFTGDKRWEPYIQQLKKASNKKDYPYTLIDSKDLPGPIPKPQHHKAAKKSDAPKKPDPKQTPKDAPAGAGPKQDAPKPEGAPSQKIKSGNIFVGGQPFADWFNANLVDKKYEFTKRTAKAKSGKLVEGPTDAGSASEVVFSSKSRGKVDAKQFKVIFDNVKHLWAEELSLAEFICFFSIFYNESGGKLKPRGEIGDAAYFFEAKKDVKGSYNVSSKGHRSAGDQLAEKGVISSKEDIERWNGGKYPHDAPDNVKKAAEECDFFKYRGHGLIQTTWRYNYLAQVDPLMKAAGLNACDTYSSAELDKILANTPAVYLGMVKNFYKHIPEFPKCAQSDPPEFWFVGWRVAGSPSYGLNIFNPRCEMLYKAMKSAGYECR